MSAMLPQMTVVKFVSSPEKLSRNQNAASQSNAYYHASTASDRTRPLKTASLIERPMGGRNIISRAFPATLGTKGVARSQYGHVRPSRRHTSSTDTLQQGELHCANAPSYK